MAAGTRFLNSTCGSKTRGMPGQARSERFLAGLAVVLPELVGGENAAEDEVGAERVEDLEDRGDVVHQREVDGLELRPEREAAVGDDERVGVPHARQQAEHGGIEDAGFEHDREEKGTSGRDGYKP